jgi:hypothetical protein
MLAPGFINIHPVGFDFFCGFVRGHRCPEC